MSKLYPTYAEIQRERRSHARKEAAHGAAMTTTISENSLIIAHQAGRAAYDAGEPEAGILAAAYSCYSTNAERDSYRAGYLGNKTRARLTVQQ